MAATKDHRLIRRSMLPLVDRGNGVRSTYSVTAEEPTATLLNGTTEFEPGGALPFHIHNCPESILVLAGNPHFETPTVSTALEPGDVTWVPTGTPHRFINRADSPARIFWTYASRDATRTLADGDLEMPIGRPEHQ